MKKITLLTANHLLVFILFLLLFWFPKEVRSQFANGADIGWLSQMESQGYIFINDSGIQKNCLTILQEHGINSLRFRVWVNPAKSWCGKKDVAMMAHRADSMGFRVMIDFHYSDYWADPGKQTKPKAWANDTMEQLLTHIYGHTYEVLDTLKYLGVVPAWVQIGNETNNGMLWPDGMASDHMDNFAAMVKSGYDAVKAVDSAIQVIVHLSNGYNNSMFRWMFDGLKNNNAKWDIIGMSLYPAYANGLSWSECNGRCLTNMKDMIARYQTEVMIVETGYAYDDPVTANHFLLDLIDKTKSVNGLGVFYWEPECYSWSGYRLGAWDPATKKPTTAMDAFLGIMDTSLMSDVKDLSNDAINIYPNPLTSNQKLTLALNEFTGSTDIRIHDINGRYVYETEVLNQKYVEINDIKMNPGIYFIQITNDRTKLMKLLIIK
jgi:arabinogalactan endo-1,4-beta-galactosidase